MPKLQQQSLSKAIYPTCDNLSLLVDIMKQNKPIKVKSDPVHVAGIGLKSKVSNPQLAAAKVAKSKQRLNKSYLLKLSKNRALRDNNT